MNGLKKILVTIALMLAGCAQSSGILKMGPDTYSVSVHAAPARGGVSGAKKLAFEEGNEHCSSLGKEFLVWYPCRRGFGCTQHLIQNFIKN